MCRVRDKAFVKELVIGVRNAVHCLRLGEVGIDLLEHLAVKGEIGAVGLSEMSGRKSGGTRCHSAKQAEGKKNEMGRGRHVCYSTEATIVFLYDNDNSQTCCHEVNTGHGSTAERARGEKRKKKRVATSAHFPDDASLIRKKR